MSISGLNGLIQQNLYKTWVKSPDEEAKEKFQQGLKGALDPANSAGPSEAITGAALSSNSTATTLWQTQAIAQSSESEAIDVEPEEVAVKKKGVSEEFLEYMDKTPEELMREEILKELGYTEEELASLDPKECAKIEMEIKERIEIKIEEAMREEGVDIKSSKGRLLNQDASMAAIA